jgi:hypothetical protein
VGQLYLPSFSETLAVARSRGQDSRAPHLWNGLVGAWPFQEGGGLTAHDVSGYGNHGTLTNGPTHVVGEKGRCLRFANNTQQVDLGAGWKSFVEGEGACVSLWLNMHSMGNGSKNVIGGNCDYSSLFMLNLYDSDDSWMYWRTAGIVCDASESITGTGWRHVLLLTSGVTTQMYLDGAAWGSDNKSNNPANTGSDTNHVYIGGSMWGAAFDMSVANVAFYSRALAPSEIQQLYADPWAQYTLRPRRSFPAAVADPLVLDDYPDLEIESPFEADKEVDTIAATGGTAPISYSIVSQDLPAGQRFAVTGDPDPDCRTTDTGAPAGEHGGEPYWTWEAGGETWYLWWYTFEGGYWIISVELGGSKGALDDWWFSDTLEAEYTAGGSETTGTTTVAHLTPFKINSSTGTIAIDDPTGLAVGQAWSVVVRATDAASETDDGTMTVTTVDGAVAGFFARRYYDTLLAGSPV